MVAVVCVAVSGCGDGLSGNRYTEENGKDGIEFKSGNKAHVTVMGQTIEADYSVDGNKITLDTKGEAGKLVVTRERDGTITGLPMCGPLKKT